MVRILQEEYIDTNLKWVRIACKHADTKPKTGLVTGSEAIEVDTGDLYRYDETSSGTWIKNPPDAAT